MNTPTDEQRMAGLFAQMVMQNTNMALIFLGQMPNPQTGETMQDLEHARFFIDQLEMLEAKTKGNLDPMETNMLKQSLTSLRLAFVEAVNHPKTPSPPAAPTPSKPAPAAPDAPATDEQETPIVEPALPGEETPPAADAESKKKFTKKY
jgi:hypothetical protein